MIKAPGRTAGGRPMLLLGLSGENMTRLMADEPITIDAQQLGLGDLVLVLVGGRDEQAIARQLVDAGLLPAEAIVQPGRLPVCQGCGHRHVWGAECAGHPWADSCRYDAGADCPGPA